MTKIGSNNGLLCLISWDAEGKTETLTNAGGVIPLLFPFTVG
jgi:hypothetical protein